MGLIDTPYGATPLEDEELEGLKIPTITTRAQLDQYEQLGIMNAEVWAFGRKRKQILTRDFTMLLHRKMFGDIWTWAGTRRKTLKNIGVDASMIDVSLGELLDDVRFQIERGTYDWDERAARFHHRLVQVHVFPNGNGRHARLFTDLLLWTNGRERFTWGERSRDTSENIRRAYISALREADQGKMKHLLEFVRS